MAKRYTETEKWGDGWFRKLPPIVKLVFMYVTDNCNVAGFYEINEGRMSSDTGLTEAECLESLGRLSKSCIIKDGWLWAVNFIKQQRNLPLNMKNNAHIGIVKLLSDQIDKFGSEGLFIEFIEKSDVDTLKTDLVSKMMKSGAKLGAKEGLPSPPVRYSKVISPNSSLEERGVGKETSLLKTGSANYYTLKTMFREQFYPDRQELNGIQQGQFTQQLMAYGEDRLKTDIEICGLEGWKSVGSLVDFRAGKLKRKAERYAKGPITITPLKSKAPTQKKPFEPGDPIPDDVKEFLGGFGRKKDTEKIGSSTMQIESKRPLVISSVLSDEEAEWLHKSQIEAERRVSTNV